MAYLIGVKIRVANYETWKANFDGSADMRKAAGEKSYRLFRSADDANELTLLCEWDTAESARRFLESEDLRLAQQASGVVEMADTWVLEEIERGTSG